MASTIQNLPIVEPRLIKDDWSEGLLRIESAGGGTAMRFVFMNVHEDGEGRYRRIIRKVVMPIDAARLIERHMNEFFARLKHDGESVTTEPTDPRSRMIENVS